MNLKINHFPSKEIKIQNEDIYIFSIWKISNSKLLNCKYLGGTYLFPNGAKIHSAYVDYDVEVINNINNEKIKLETKSEICICTNTDYTKICNDYKDFFEFNISLTKFHIENNIFLQIKNFNDTIIIQNNMPINWPYITKTKFICKNNTFKINYVDSNKEIRLHNFNIEDITNHLPEEILNNEIYKKYRKNKKILKIISNHKLINDELFTFYQIGNKLTDLGVYLKYLENKYTCTTSYGIKKSWIYNVFKFIKGNIIYHGNYIDNITYSTFLEGIISELKNVSEKEIHYNQLISEMDKIEFNS